MSLNPQILLSLVSVTAIAGDLIIVATFSIHMVGQISRCPLDFGLLYLKGGGGGGLLSLFYSYSKCI